MAVLEKIVIQDWRNIALQEIEFSRKFNCVTGGNGEGKTNLLDAIWYLSMTKSAFSPSENYNYRHGVKAFGLSGSYLLENGLRTRVSIRVSEGGEKKVKRDDKAYGRVSEHIGLLPIVMVSPSDTAMVSESGEERRKFVNSVLSQMDPVYLNNVQQYNKLLLQRNALLRDGSADGGLLDIIEERMDCFARPVFESRKRFTEELNPVVSEYYERISGGKEKVGISYRSQLESGSFADMLRERRGRDSILKYTTAGLQRDDFLFEMEGYPLRRCGSQGQQKSFLVALKFAQYEIMKSHYGFPPMLLLDDLFDKLDSGRVGNLLKTVSGSDFGQVFLSDTSLERTRESLDILGTDARFYKAKEGVFSYE